MLYFKSGKHQLRNAATNVLRTYLQMFETARFGINERGALPLLIGCAYLVWFSSSELRACSDYML